MPDDWLKGCVFESSRSDATRDGTVVSGKGATLIEPTRCIEELRKQPSLFAFKDIPC